MIDDEASSEQCKQTYSSATKLTLREVRMLPASIEPRRQTGAYYRTTGSLQVILEDVTSSGHFIRRAFRNQA
jgi:hypothetical protein